MNWIVKIGDAEYPAQNDDMILEWIRLGRVTPDSTIFNPLSNEWLTVLKFAETLGPGVLVSTTGTLEGFRIVQYLGLTSGEATTTPITHWDTHKEMMSMRERATFMMQQRALLTGGNGVVGVEIDFFQFTELVLHVHVYGTVVVLEKLPQS